MRKVCLFILLFLGVANSFQAIGQLYNFANYSLEQGLPQSSVYSIFQDTRGYLWVGTESGVARFNGLQFTVFDRSNGLPGNIVRSIIEGPDGNIWVGTDMGIGIFDGNNWRKITSKDGLKGSAIIKLVPDEKGNVWVATNDAGINIIKQVRDSISISHLDKSNGLSADFVFDILHEKNGKTWVALIGGINIVNQKDEKFVVSNLEDSVSIPSNYVTCVDKDDNENLWFGTLNAGAFELVKKNRTYHVVQFNQSKGIIDQCIWDVFCDGHNQVWFGTKENGVYHWNDGEMLNINSKQGLPGDQVLTFLRDRSRNLWLGTMNGLSMFKGFQLIHYTNADGLPGTQVLAIKSDAKNSLWVGGDGKGLAKIKIQNEKIFSTFFDSRSGFRNSEVRSIDFDGQGNLLIGTQSEGVGVMQKGHFRYITSVDGLANDNINCVYWNKYGSIYAGTDLGYNEIKQDKIYTIGEEQGLIHPEVQTVISDLKGDIWMGTMGGLARFHPINGNYRDFNEQEGLFDLRIHALTVDKLNQLYIGTSNGIYRYDEKRDTIVPFLSNELNAKTINSLIFCNDTTLIVGTTLGFNKIFFNKTLSKPISIKSYDKTDGFKFSETNINAICKGFSNDVWFGTINGLTRYQPQLEDTITETPRIHITGIRLSFESVDWSKYGYEIPKWENIPQALNLKYNQNHITFDFDGLYLRNPEKVKFRYKLEPNEKVWSPASSGKSVTYSSLNDGNFTFLISASADGVHWSLPMKYNLTIAPPFWKTAWFYITCVLIIVVSLIFYIRYREKKLKKEKEYLEQVVKERTAEVVAQKDHIEQQHKIVTHQKEEITASITYARRIQQAVLPGIEILSENTADSFVLYKPRDIVSGDFYWIGKSNSHLIVTAADCTGHGVPGAFMSMLGISFMNKIIKEQKIELPDQILGQMRNNVITSLKQGNYEGTTKDGMDMALCAINLETLELIFAGAYNPAILVSGDEVTEIKANRMPVGLHMVMDDFTHETVQLKKGDCIYMFSDGFQDQMGGPDGRKFMRKNLRELLLSIHSKPFCEQKEILDNTIESWRNDPSNPSGEIDQMDDILVLGFSV